MKIIEQTKEHLIVETSCVTSSFSIDEELLFGAHPGYGWQTGEHKLIDALRESGHITSPAEGIDDYSPEAKEVVDLARAFFGYARSLGAAGRTEFAYGLLFLEIEPAAE